MVEVPPPPHTRGLRGSEQDRKRQMIKEIENRLNHQNGS
jgi:hypothetical protein